MANEYPDYSRSRAVLIGTSSYQDRAYRSLPAAANSLEGLHEVLAHRDLCGWPDDRITVAHNPIDSRRLVTELRHLSAETDDVLLLYFVGHGTITPDGELCLAFSDTSFSNPTSPAWNIGTSAMLSSAVPLGSRS